jgi:cytochrome c biogenesis protein CcmG, thiol:disulfide interchange protein DsbE
VSRLLRPLPIVVLIAVFALLGLLAYGVASKSPSDSIDARLAQGERVVAPTPAWPALAGRRGLSLADYRGRVVVLNFWASWCVPCRQEASLLERWQRNMAPRGGTVLGVDVLDVTSDAQSFVRQFGITYPIARDRDGSTLKSFQVLGYPETLVIDRRGRIAATRRYPVDERFLDQAVLPLLREHA